MVIASRSSIPTVLILLLSDSIRKLSKQTSLPLEESLHVSEEEDNKLHSKRFQYRVSNDSSIVISGNSKHLCTVRSRSTLSLRLL